MDFSLDDEQRALSDSVRRWCDSNAPAERRGNRLDAAAAATLRDGLAGLGLTGLALPEQYGGSGLSSVELMLTAQELGRALVDGDWFASAVLGGPLLASAGAAHQQARWLPDVASGALRLAVALHEEAARYDWTRTATRARATASGYLLDGSKQLVIQGESADLFLVLARLSGQPGERAGLGLLAVPRDCAGLTVRGFDTLDNRRAAHLELRAVSVPADHLIGAAAGEPADAATPATDPLATAEVVEATLARACAVLCGEAAGALDALLAQTIEHLRSRQQFGQPLARFQALQHRLADLFGAVEQVKSLACAAALAADGSDRRARARICAAAKVLAGQLGREAGLTAIQMHGAMGMTDECRIGHYAKRLMVINSLCGDARHHLQTVARLAATP